MEESEKNAQSSEHSPLEQESSRTLPPDDGDAGPAGADSSEKASAKVKKNVPFPRGPKRRTKTGCLTCRKRRIKCGEEKPRCNNCIKARRECEGYTQRVIFKHALGPFGAAYPAGLPAELQSTAMRMPLLPQQQQQQQQQHGQAAAGQALNPQQRLLAPRMPHVATPPMHLSYGLPDPVAASLHHRPQQFFYPSAHGTPSQLGQAVTGQPYLALGERGGVQHGPPLVTSQAGYQASLDTGTSFEPDYNLLSHDDVAGNVHVSIRNQYLVQTGEDSHAGPVAQSYQGGASSWDAGEEARGPYNAPQPFSQVAYYDDEAEEDDYYDVDSNDEMEYATTEEGLNQMSLIIASAQQGDNSMRSYNTYLNEPNVLASYFPSMGSSPLNNPKTARIWVHFIHATGPSLSIWERHSLNSSALFTGPVPLSQQGLWNYTLPLKALEHPALLQSILAISSLHIAKLQQSHATVAFKHYQYALRKLSKAVGLPLRRKQVATLAATLILSFYEVISAEHYKWDSHIAGAAQLLKEIDFAGLTRDLRAHRRSVRLQRLEGWGHYNSFPSYNHFEDDPFADKELEVNMSVVSTLTGKVVDYDRMGHVEYENFPRVGKRQFTRKDIENYRLQCDLFWWYCKHDITQSMISGNKFYNPYDRWMQCPPRAALGKPDAIYGSWDHLVLLMARMMDFGYRDRKRKISSLEANGGEWKPHPGFFKFMARYASKPPAGGAARGPGPSSQPTDDASKRGSQADSSHRGGQTGERFSQSSSTGSQFASAPATSGAQQSSNKSTGQVQMYGMVPSTGPGAPPAAFTEAGESPPYSGGSESESQMSLSEAESEWESILAAYDFYATQLGDAFAPLPADSAPPISTPFGPALQYRSYLIAVLWAFYYTGRLMHMRLHPCMPPATMISTVTAAGATTQYTQIIGKIVAGIYYPQLYKMEAGSLNPTLGGALIQITVPIFFAGVQFTDAAQRGWTVAILRNISRLTGWQTADAIAGGCESAWYYTAKAGRGPPYTSEDISKREEDMEWRYHRRDHHADKQLPLEANKDRRFVTVAKSTRTHWAMGLLELESDLGGLDLDNPP